MSVERDDWGQPLDKPPWRPDAGSPPCMEDTFPADQAERDRRADEAKKIRNRLRRLRFGVKEGDDGTGSSRGLRGDADEAGDL